MTLCMNHWLSFNTVVEHIFTLTGATWSSRNVIGPAQFMSYWPSSKGLKHLAHMNKESRANILQSTPDNIFMPQHKNSVLNADVSSKRGSSSQAPVSSQATQGYERTQNSTTAPYFGFISEKTFSGAKRWIDRKIDTNKTSKFTTTDGGWCRWLRYIAIPEWANTVLSIPNTLSETKICSLNPKGRRRASPSLLCESPRFFPVCWQEKTSQVAKLLELVPAWNTETRQ